ncbi:site-specific DNA-methyltransferase (adenine-specific) [Weissella uvarum]|uniref:class I SAM-dependent methyltransferase n=1 Tax=Weissella uvarum TaxID=1479233 RepID=UPI001960FEDA|nr:class I SAM-dependent methyltransferase [Weissella uvarum]MBM7617770.1 site-specific DNA-methyltransferase (adenine-specific) [Weissella uvarum]MCM0595851.1 class I SAM-dependent methyltransferase [Weissella uvarum]
MYDEIEDAIKQIQAGQERLIEQLDIPAIDALILAFEGLTHQNDEAFDQLEQAERKAVRKNLKDSQFATLKLEQKRQVLQLLLVATVKQDQLQGNYQPTPDAIGMWVSFLAEKFLPSQSHHRILDLTLGTGNLLATVNLALNQRGDQGDYFGVENDDTMITVASGVAALLDLDWHLIHQDTLDTDDQQETKDMDLVIGDLPVGYYPKTDIVGYATQQEEGMTYVHHLLIEETIRHLRPGGLGVLVVPANLFESDQAASLLKYFQTDEMYFQAFIQFSDNLFLDKKARKALLVIQKAGDDAKQAEPVLLAKAPEVNHSDENLNFVNELNDWLIDNELVH